MEIAEDWILAIRSSITTITTTSKLFLSEKLTDRNNLRGNYGFSMYIFFYLISMPSNYSNIWNKSTGEILISRTFNTHALHVFPRVRTTALTIRLTGLRNASVGTITKRMSIFFELFLYVGCVEATSGWLYFRWRSKSPLL